MKVHIFFNGSGYMEDSNGKRTKEYTRLWLMRLKEKWVFIIRYWRIGVQITVVLDK